MSPRQKAPRGIRGGSVTTVRNAEPERAAPLDAFLHRAPAMQRRRVELPVRLHVVKQRRLPLARPHAQPAGAAGVVKRRPLPVGARELRLAALLDVAEIQEDSDGAVVLLRAVHLGVEVVVVRVVLLVRFVAQDLQRLRVVEREPCDGENAVDDRVDRAAVPLPEPRLARRSDLVDCGLVRVLVRNHDRPLHLRLGVSDNLVALGRRHEVLDVQDTRRVADVLHRKVGIEVRLVRVLEESWVLRIRPVVEGLGGGDGDGVDVIVAEIVDAAD
mmetsp:Transcript_44610/g.137666  ORF Transcript_44610/g.137666 Transcript_44610/m.137666 type:complete len:272 (-) Transcript_44610:288-1103(-)